MQTRFVMTAEELYQVIVSAFEANGHRPTTLAFFSAGAEVQLERVEVVAEEATLTVRCTPENSLNQAIQARYDTMVNNILRHGLGPVATDAPAPAAAVAKPAGAAP